MHYTIYLHIFTELYALDLHMYQVGTSCTGEIILIIHPDKVYTVNGRV